MGAIVIRTRYDEGTESDEVATSGLRIGDLRVRDHHQNIVENVLKAVIMNEVYSN
jgi:hypothetical protein